MRRRRYKREKFYQKSELSLPALPKARGFLAENIELEHFEKTSKKKKKKMKKQYLMRQS